MGLEEFKEYYDPKPRMVKIITKGEIELSELTKEMLYEQRLRLGYASKGELVKKMPEYVTATVTGETENFLELKKGHMFDPENRMGWDFKKGKIRKEYINIIMQCI